MEKIVCVQKIWENMWKLAVFMQSGSFRFSHVTGENKEWMCTVPIWLKLP